MVMPTASEHSHGIPPTAGDTREEVLRLVLTHGPITAAELGKILHLSAAGIRRHLDNLVSDGLAQSEDRKQRSGRGRPARYFQLTDKGRSHFGHRYDSLANSALAALREVGGREAVHRFAQRRIQEVVDSVPDARDNSESIAETTQRLAKVFDEQGYAVTVTRAGTGIQLCHHHCPVAAVAAENPEICEAEHEVIASKVGLHIQPLASIVDGHGICTTNIPLNASERGMLTTDSADGEDPPVRGHTDELQQNNMERSAGSD